MRVRVDRVSGASATNAGTLGAGPGAQGQPLTLNVSPPFTEDQSPTVRARRLSGTERRRRRAGRLFVAPVVVIILAAVALPLGQAIYYSFTQWNGLTSVFSGLQNYTT